MNSQVERPVPGNGLRQQAAQQRASDGSLRPPRSGRWQVHFLAADPLLSQVLIRSKPPGTVPYPRNPIFLCVPSQYGFF